MQMIPPYLRQPEKIHMLIRIIIKKSIFLYNDPPMRHKGFHIRKKSVSLGVSHFIFVHM